MIEGVQVGEGKEGPSLASEWGWRGSDSLMDQGSLVGPEGVPGLEWQAMTQLSVLLPLLMH